MIGQKRLLNIIDSLEECPRFIAITGEQGCGKKMIARLLAEKFNYQYVECGIKVDEVRQIIELANTMSLPTMYCFPDIEKMSIQAKNALLKVTEEPPKNSAFVVTLEDLSQTLGTIRSRSYHMPLDPYTYEDLKLLYEEVCELPFNEDLLIGISRTPKDILTFCDIDFKQFIEYVDLVIDNIGAVSSANAFKSGQKIAFKEDSEKYDLELFWRAFMSLCIKRIKEDPRKYALGVSITSDYLKKLRVTGINKQMTYDAWVLGIRRWWED